MRSNGPLANKEVAIGGHRWPWVARAPGGAESGLLVRRMSHRVDPAAIAEEARTVRLDAVLGPPRRSATLDPIYERIDATPRDMLDVVNDGVGAFCQFGESGSCPPREMMERRIEQEIR